MFKNENAGFLGAECLISHHHAVNDKNSVYSLY